VSAEASDQNHAVAVAVPTDGYAFEDLLAWYSAERFLVTEAELLDDHRYRDWLGLLSDDVVYRAPVRTTRRSDGRVDPELMFWFDESRISLELRVRRLETDVNWAEEPPSRTRRFVSNVRVRPAGDEGVVEVFSNLACHRNRGEAPTSDLIVAQRHDHLRDEDGQWRLLRREIRFDHGTLSTKNLALLF
jgi:PAH dioxygenase small subunit